MKRFCLPIALLFAVSSVYAGDCRVRSVQYQYQYQAPVQYQAPTYDYGQYIVVSKAFRELVDPECYNYSTVDISTKLKIYKEMYADQIRRELKSAQENPGTPSSDTLTRQSNPEVTLNKGTGAGKSQTQQPPLVHTGNGINPQLRAVIKNKCISCHADGANKINLSENYLDKLTLEQWGKAAWQVSKNWMPKDAEPLPQEEFTLFDKQADQMYSLAFGKVKP